MQRLWYLAFAGVLLTSACTIETNVDDAATLEITNESSATIWELYVAPISALSWGLDELGATVLDPGESVLVFDVPCDFNEVLLVDFDGDECLLDSEWYCDEDYAIYIYDSTLSGCPYFD